MINSLPRAMVYVYQIHAVKGKQRGALMYKGLEGNLSGVEVSNATATFLVQTDSLDTTRSSLPRLN